MHHPWFLVVVTAGLSSLSAAGATHADQLPRPSIIPGIGPEQAALLSSIQRLPPAGIPAQRVASAAPASSGAYGGGFVEWLITGRDSSAAVLYNAPQRVASYGPPRASDAVGKTIDPMYARQEVDYHGPQGSGTIVIDTPNKFLYLVIGRGRALRYGIGVGRPGFEWSGSKVISRKAEWPDWTPPSEMLLRRPDLPRHMDGGIANPLGARALYLGSSLYRIHGTNEPETIGTNVSSGCIRMLNEDVIDLYNRVRVGTKVQVI